MQLQARIARQIVWNPYVGREKGKLGPHIPYKDNNKTNVSEQYLTVKKNYFS